MGVLATLIRGRETPCKSFNGKEALNIASINDRSFVVLAMTAAKRTRELGGGREEMRSAAEAIFEFAINNLKLYDLFNFESKDISEISEVAAEYAVKDLEMEEIGLL